MLNTSGSPGPFESDNPERDVPIYYFLEEKQEGPLQIEIFDEAGKTVRSYSSEESDFERCRLANMDPRHPFELEYPAANKGLNKWTWNMQGANVHCIEDVSLFAGFGGPTVAPGDYKARVSVGGLSEEMAFTLTMDPRVTATPAEIDSWTATVNETATLLDEVLQRLGEARKARNQIEALMADYPGNEALQKNGKSAIEAINAWDYQLNQPLHETYEDEDAWETMLAGQIRFLLDVIDDSGAPVTGGAMQRLNDLKSEWAQRKSELRNITATQIDAINTWAKEKGVPHVAVPSL